MKKRKKSLWSRLIFISVAVLAASVLLLAGCGQNSGSGDEGAQNPGTDQQEPAGEPDISAKPADTKQTVTLYFGDDQAMYLIPEQREVTKGDETLEAVIIRELAKGPQKEGLTRTIPDGAELLSVSVVNGVAYVNFSEEFKSKHWGGSAGESTTIYSVTNTLCKLPGIEQVQFLLEGDKQESILGNIGTIEPVSPDWDLVQE